MPHCLHLAGIGGVGMSALAQALVDSGAQVTGSDRFLDQGRELEVFATLRAAGVCLKPQDGSALSQDTTALVVSTAVESDNLEIAAAQRLQIPVRHRAEMLAELVRPRRLAAVAGTCGKTTVTGMLGTLLEFAGFDPCVINGGEVTHWRSPLRLGSVRAGRGDWAVIEADESDRSFLRYSPEWAILTNISKDHFEYGIALDLFSEFTRRVKTGLVLGPQAAAALEGRIQGLDGIVVPPSKDWMAHADGTQSFTFENARFELAMPGRHNADNACAALALARRLGAPLDALREGLRGFRGIHRRLERTGVFQGAAVYDDYGHNPEKIRAAWTAIASTARRVHGVWRPHGFGPLSLMMHELATMWAETMRSNDRLALLPVFYAGGTTSGKASSDDLAARITAAGRHAEVTPDYTALERWARAGIGPGDALLVMGARDPDLPLFARRMGCAEST